MNRLWVRISLLLALVVVFMAFFPAIMRQVRPQAEFYRPPRPAELPAEVLERVPPERIDRYREEIRDQAWTNTWVTIVIGGIIGLGFGVGISRTLTRPLGELVKGANAVAAHQLSYRVPTKGSAEIQSVAHAFNEMASELEGSEALRRNMLADVTHELRHPVHVLRGNLQGILDGVFPLDLEEITLLSEQTQHLSQLINELHDLALAEAQELPLTPQEIDLKELVGNALEAIQPLLLAKELSLKIDLPPEAILAEVDAGRIRQVIWNLMSNGVRYTPAGGEIQVSLLRRDVEAEIRVTDTGIGIAAEDLPFVFNRFYRSDASRNREEGGTGLGLAIARAIVESHQGRLTVSSEGVGKGSSFVIALPLE